ncbi:MAG: ABC transporter permease [Candidatus ainarchaeum sp.]|nr:ABC transporter permease [Candidatus ainarchaeum sp.]
MKKIYFLIGPIVFIVIWELVYLSQIINNFFLPSPQEVFLSLITLFSSLSIFLDLGITAQRVFISLTLAIIIGFPIGLLLGYYEKVYASLEVLIDFFRSIPPIALFPLFVLILGIGDSSKIGAAIFAATLLIIFNTAKGIINTKKTRILAAKLMGATKKQIFGKILLWESLPQTIIGLRTAASFSLVVIVATEMFIGTYAGLGRRIIDFQYIYNVSGMYAVILITGLFGFALNFVFIWLEKRYVHWYGK